MRTTFLALPALLALAPLGAPALSIKIEPSQDRRPISRLIYGSNNNFLAFAPLRRFGGNRLSGYNWENNASNAGADWKHQSDTWLLTQVQKPLPDNLGQAPGAVLVEQARHIRSGGGEPLLTFQMAGFVAADNLGPVSSSQKAPSSRWVPVLFRKPGAPASYAYPPDKSDRAVYMDELAAHLVSTFKAGPGGKIKYYCLDNEPDLWSDGKGGHTHPRLHPAQPSYAEVVERSSALAAALLDVDPDAQFFAPVNYGWQGFRTLQEAPDHKAFNAQYGWFVAYYLDQMRQASQKAGKRLLHYYDLHYYTEAQGPGGRVNNLPSRTGRADCEARMQAPRSLWDPGFVEKSWITEHSLPSGDKAIRLLPRVKADIAKYYPGTKLALTEWQFGAEDHLSGALAACDTLGIFGKEGVDAACAWPQDRNDFLAAAFRLYLGEGTRPAFGDTSVRALSSDIPSAPAYAAADSKDPSRLTVVVVNRTWDQALKTDVSVALAAGKKVAALRAWRIQGKTAKVEEVKAPAPAGAGFADDVPAMSATLYELKVK